MGTNYYAVPNRPSVRSPIHIGKSSYGWLFCFQTQNDPWRDVPVVWNTYPQVKEWLYDHTVMKQNYVIMNEYDEIVSYDAFIGIVTGKQMDPNCKNNPDNFAHDKNIDGYWFCDEYFS